MNISSTSTPARILMVASCTHVAMVSLQDWIPIGPRALGVGAHPGRHPQQLVGHLAHPDRVAAYAVRTGEHHLGPQLVVTLAEHGRRDLELLADASPSQGCVPG